MTLSSSNVVDLSLQENVKSEFMLNCFDLLNVYFTALFLLLHVLKEIVKLVLFSP